MRRLVSPFVGRGAEYVRLVPPVSATPVDPRDQTWESESARYRVYFYDADGASDEWELSDVDAPEAFMWAQHTCAGRRYNVYLRVDLDGLGLVQLTQSAPVSTRPSPSGSPAVGSEPTSPISSAAASLESWSSRNFSLANARDDRPGNLPHLLRRLAAAIEDRAITADELLDVTISDEITAEGLCWSATVYWSANLGP